MGVKAHIRARAPRVRIWWRRLSRLRWMAKLKVVRYCGASLRDPRALRYLLLDPEVESHTYEIANVEAIVAELAEVLRIDASTAHAYAREASTAPELTVDLRARTRRAFDLKTQPPIALRLLWWVIVRARRPGLVVETGAYDGLGSLVVLAALRRNAAEGAPGTLLSVDTDPYAGRLVPDDMRAEWEFVVGRTDAVLERAIGGRPVDVLLHDTPHVDDVQTLEFGLALRHAAGEVVLVDNGGGQAPTLARIVGATPGARMAHIVPEPRDHIYRSPGIDVGVVPVPVDPVATGVPLAVPA